MPTTASCRRKSESIWQKNTAIDATRLSQTAVPRGKINPSVESLLLCPRREESLFMKKLLCGVLCLAALPAVAANQVVEAIVARVNNRVITLSEYQRAQEETRQEAQQEDSAN